MNHLGIFIGVCGLAFALILLFDELCSWFSRHRAKQQPQPLQLIRSEPNEIDRIEWDWPANVRPIHHRRSLAQPYLKVVPTDEPTRALIDGPDAR